MTTEHTLPETEENGEKNEMTVQTPAESIEMPDGIVIESGDLTFKLDIFEGPLDLLLALIAKNKVNIYDIPIALILDQYLEYIHQMNLFNLEVASEFIVMAAQLMVIKSRLLLPRIDEEEEDPRQELVDLLLEYQRAKKASEVLHELEFSYAGRFEKPPMPLPDDPDKTYKLTHDLSLLEAAYKRVYERNLEQMEIAQNAESLNTLIRTTRHVSVNEKILHVMKRVEQKGRVVFSTLFEKAESRNEIVATFLAVLELIKAKRIMVSDMDEAMDDCLLVPADDAQEAAELPLVEEYDKNGQGIL